MTPAVPAEEMQSGGPTDPRSAPHPDGAVVALANRQHGVVSRRQLPALGLTPTMVRDRVRRGTLTPLHRGVYAVGHQALSPAGRALAAVLAAGPGAVLSHRDAARLHGLRPGNHRGTDVSTARRVKSTAAIHVHRTTILTADDVTAVDGIPVTSVARTLVDLAAVVPRDHLAKAFGEAERLRLADLRTIEAAMTRTRTRRGNGHRILRAVLAEHRERGLELTRSELEDRFLALVRDAALPAPRLNAIVLGHEVDATWPRAGVAVELDGWRFHRGRRAFQRDREKANTLTAGGWRVLRFTHRDVVHERARTVAVLRAALGR